jgi:hypothetical protein
MLRNLPRIRLLKTSGGDEFLAKIISETDDTLTVEKPLQLMRTENGMGFVPFVMLADQDKPMILNKSLILVETFALKQVESQYETATSGIVLPQSGGIIT